MTRTCPWPEIEKRECGFWVDQNAPAIAAALRVLADDPARRAPDGGARGRVRARAVRLGRDRAGDVPPLRRARCNVPAPVISSRRISPARRHFHGRAPGRRRLRRRDGPRVARAGREGPVGRDASEAPAAARRASWRLRPCGAVSGDRSMTGDRESPAPRAGGAGLRRARRLAGDDSLRRRGVEAAHLAAARGARSRRAARRRLGVLARQFPRGQPAFRRRAIDVCHLGLEPVPAAHRRRRRAPSALIVGRMAGDERYKGHDLLIDIWRGGGRRRSRARCCASSATATIGRGSSRRRPRSISATDSCSSAGGATSAGARDTAVHGLGHAQPRRRLRPGLHRSDARRPRLHRRRGSAARDHRRRRDRLVSWRPATARSCASVVRMLRDRAAAGDGRPRPRRASCSISPRIIFAAACTR